MMGTIDRYIFRSIFGVFLLITNQGQTILVFLRIISLLLPILMLVIAPIAIMIAVCYMLIKLNGDLVVMNAAGLSPARVFRPGPTTRRA